MTNANSFAEAYALVAAGNRRTLERLEDFLNRLRARGADFILLKGADMVTRADLPLGVRQVGDADLLVRPRDLPAVEEAAREMGLRQRVDGNAAFVDAEGCFVADVMTGVWYLEDDGELWARSRARDALGGRVRSLDATDALLFSCAWTSLHRAWLRPAFAQDVEALTRAERVDWPRFCADARRLGLRAAARHALLFAARRRRLDLPLEGLAPRSARERLADALLARLVTEERLYGLSHLLVVLTHPPGRRLAALRKWVFPDAAFMRYRYGERAGFGQRAARPFYLAWSAGLVAVRAARRLARP